MLIAGPGPKPSETGCTHQGSAGKPGSLRGRVWRGDTGALFSASPLARRQKLRSLAVLIQVPSQLGQYGLCMGCCWKVHGHSAHLIGSDWTRQAPRLASAVCWALPESEPKPGSWQSERREGGATPESRVDFSGTPGKGSTCSCPCPFQILFDKLKYPAISLSARRMIFWKPLCCS